MTVMQRGASIARTASRRRAGGEGALADPGCAGRGARRGVAWARAVRRARPWHLHCTHEPGSLDADPVAERREL